MNYDYDLIVIGAGSAGYNGAALGARRGLRVASSECVWNAWCAHCSGARVMREVVKGEDENRGW